jgi:hypothetical protein
MIYLWFSWSIFFYNKLISHVQNVPNLSLDIAPRHIIRFIAYNPILTRATRVTRSSRPIPFDAEHQRPPRIRRGYTVFRFRRNGFKDPSVYRRELLSLLSEHSLVALNSPQSRRILSSSHTHIRIYNLYLYFLVLFLFLLRPSAFPYRSPRRCTCFFFRRVQEPVPLCRVVEKSQGSLKETGRFKAVVVFPTAASAEQIWIISSSSPRLLALAASFSRQTIATRSSSRARYRCQLPLRYFDYLRSPA